MALNESQDVVNLERPRGKMSFYQRILFPLLQRVDAERAHDLTIRALATAQSGSAGRLLLQTIAGTVPQRQRRVFGLTFPNELGVAAGYDKNGQAVLGLSMLGFGHIEVGTVTPWAQAGNPRPRIFRLPEEAALINRMGFPNHGMARVAARLRQLKERRVSARPFILGVSLGKQKETPLAEAAEDYVIVMRAVHAFADYLAINVSSPNTPGLRALQGRAYLEGLLERLQEENLRLGADTSPRPILLKVAPDLTWAEIDVVLDAATRSGIDGLIATNTTVTRPGLAPGLGDEAGGLSGVPLAERSLAVVSYICGLVGDALPVIAVGGIRCADDVRARLDVGARLVQIYTALVFEGPRLPGRILRRLEPRST